MVAESYWNNRQRRTYEGFLTQTMLDIETHFTAGEICPEVHLECCSRTNMMVYSTSWVCR